MSSTVDSTIKIPIEKFSQAGAERQWDSIVVEEPLKLILEWGPAENRQLKSLAFLMRTPGDDYFLVLGFLFTEGVITNYTDVLEVQLSSQDSITGHLQSTAYVSLKVSAIPHLETSDRFSFSAASCGMCGKTTDPLISPRGAAQLTQVQPFKADIFLKLPQKMQAAQNDFQHTGGLHASALFSSSGTLLYLKEDIGRHNATDKIIGACLANAQPCSSALLLVSGRVSVEIIQKAIAAKIPVVAALGAPSSLAIKFADASDISLIGFLKRGGFNLYSGAHRIVR